MIIAVLGATGTGKTQLTLALRRWLASQAFENPLHMGPNSEVWDSPTWSELEALNRPLNRRHMKLLLMGLDLPHSNANQPFPTRIQNEQAQQDSALRSQLQSQAWSYGVVYGQGEIRLQHALRFLVPQNAPAARWRGLCEGCSDPDCERRLFTALKGLTAAESPPR
ncbi:MAG: hypothetical protein EBR27_09895 [Betaproteobacteria bacterium]|nr:hypothetical protein [Betaproteobacteria bacterium]NDD15245.1 hypothetical protein [Betaproteobacteria bacterium]